MNDRSTDAPAKPLVWILGLQFLLVLPFIAQPMHMDDHIYVDIGRNVLETPWHAHDFPYCFEGACVADVASHSHPPLIGYWIGLLLWLFGDGPGLHVTLHAGFLVFPLLFAIGMYRLATRFTGSPTMATLVAVASPAATVLSHNLMSDYPTLALWTFGTALYVDGVDTGRPRTVWIAGMALALAAFASYPALAAAVLCGLYGLLRKSRMRAAYLAPLAVTGFMAVWLTYSSLYFGRFVLGGTAEYFVETHGSLGAAAVTDKLLGALVLLAPTLAVPLPLIWSGFAWLRARPAIIWLMTAAAAAQVLARGYAPPQRLMIGIMLALAGWIVLGLATRPSAVDPETPDRRRDAFFLMAWFGAVAAALVLVYAVASVRYMLPMLPPLVLLAFMAPSPVPRAWHRPMGVASVLASVALGAALSVADLEAARIPRAIATSLGTALDGWEDRTRFGGEWGFRYYMEAEGFRQFLSTSHDMSGGQFVITPHQAVPYPIGQDVATMLVPIGERTVSSPFPLRLMDRGLRAGFYSSDWGILPFWVSRAPIEGATIQQVSYLVERLPETVLEGAGALATTIPRPVPEGGIELLLPVPGRLRIPWDAGPARVAFSCRRAGGEVLDPCPVRIRFETGGEARTLAIADRSDGSPPSFLLDTGEPGSLTIDTPDSLPGGDSQLAIRNWTVLPPGGLE